MKNFIVKQDNTAPPTGNLTAIEFNNYIEESENAVALSGQTLDTPTDTTRQFIQALAVGGERKARTTGQTAEIGEIVLADNSAAIVTVNMPSANLFVNATVEFEPIENQLWSVFALTIGRNGNLIMGIAEDMVVNSTTADDLKFKMTWKGGTVGWVVSRTELVGSTI